MALSYNYEKCDDSNWTEDDRNIAGQFCWTLMAVEMQDVTEKNKNWYKTEVKKILQNFL